MRLRVWEPGAVGCGVRRAGSAPHFLGTSAPSTPSCETFSHLLNVPQPQFLPLCNGDYSGTRLTELLRR